MPARTIGFKKIKIGVKYETNYGEEIWIIGSDPVFGNWNPAHADGKSGIKAIWSEGHVWYAELDYEMLRGLGRVEFKFIVKQTHNGGGHYNVVRWEGGGNHNCDIETLHRLLTSDTVTMHV